VGGVVRRTVGHACGISKVKICTCAGVLGKVDSAMPLQRNPQKLESRSRCDVIWRRAKVSLHAVSVDVSTHAI